MSTDRLPLSVILDTEKLIDRLIWSIEPIVLTQHDVHTIISAIVSEMDTAKLEDYYESLTEIDKCIHLVDFETRFSRMEERHALLSAIVEFGVFLMELVMQHKLYFEGEADPFPFIFVGLTCKATILRRVNFTPL